jgi:hypothetical protein
MVVFKFQKNILAVLKNKIIFALLKFSKFNKLSENKSNKVKIYFWEKCRGWVSQPANSTSQEEFLTRGRPEFDNRIILLSVQIELQNCE